jgi:hypothetical protein
LITIIFCRAGEISGGLKDERARRRVPLAGALLDGFAASTKSIDMADPALSSSQHSALFAT